MPASKYTDVEVSRKTKQVKSAAWHAVERMQQLISVLGVSLAFNSICFSVGLVSYWTKALQSLAWVQCPVPPSTAGPWQWLLLVLYRLLCFSFRC